MLYYKLKCDFIFYEDHLKTLRPNHEDIINSYFEKLQETDGIKAHRWLKCIEGDYIEK